MEIRSGYRNDEKLRASLSGLARETFGIDLAGWYDNGFWGDDYIPYSVVEDGEVVANVSVNVCNMKWRTRVHHLAQLGTVMTRPDHRGKGLIRKIMEYVQDDCDRMFEGTYLYAEDHMAPFYEKFGFVRNDEYQCRKKVDITNKPEVEKVSMDSKEEWDRMVDIIQRRPQYGERVMVNNTGLFMFYISGIMSDSVYYIPSSDSYVIAGRSNDVLTLYAVFSSEKVSLGDVIASFGSDVKNVTLAFTPENNTGFEQKKIKNNETVFFTRGPVFERMSGDRYMFPEISHA